jgi:membrane-associated phospholipid phosphatase
MQPKDWKRFGIGVAVIAPFFFADEPLQKYVVDLTNNNPSMGKVSKFITNMGGPYEAVTLGLMAGYGIVFKKEKIKTTALLASQSYIISGAMQSVIKLLTGRQRPYVYDPNQVQAEPTFHGPFHPPFKDANGKTITSSFPSGHTTGAFAAATVFAMEYRDRPAVKIIAYGSASLIGLSRITENKHWITDVLTGAALGFLSGRQVVNNYHRYAEIKNAEKKKKGSVSFNISYQSGVFLPQVIYTFR